MEDQNQQIAPKPSRRSARTVTKVIAGLLLLIAVGLTVYISQQEQDNRQEAFFFNWNRDKIVARPTATPSPVLPTMTPLSQDDVYTLLTQVELELDNYLEQYAEDVQQSEQVNGSLDYQTL